MTPRKPYPVAHPRITVEIVDPPPPPRNVGRDITEQLRAVYRDGKPIGFLAYVRRKTQMIGSEYGWVARRRGGQRIGNPINRNLLTFREALELLDART